jgi:AcrR family transcriptional regulator
VPRISKKSGTYHHGDLRRVLLETAVRVVEKDGLAALSLQALSRRAGVSSAAPYYHFESREQLLAAIAEQGFALLVAEMHRAAAETGTDARAHLEGLGRGYVRFALAHRGHFRVMFRPELQSQVDPAKKAEFGAAFHMLKAAIARCQAEGVAPPGDPARLVLIAWSAVHGASSLWIDGSLDADQLVPDGETLATTVAATIVELIAGAAPKGKPRQPGAVQ